MPVGTLANVQNSLRIGETKKQVWHSLLLNSLLEHTALPLLIFIIFKLLIFIFGPYKRVVKIGSWVNVAFLVAIASTLQVLIDLR